MTLLLSLALLWASVPVPAHPPARPYSPVHPQDSLPYRLAAPSLVINLVSGDLQEISGLSPTDEPGVFCAVSDEKGEILFIDGAGGGAILRRILFREKGDFEGVERAGKCLYALKSDGDLFEIAHWQQGQPKVTVYKTPLTKADDVEGLGYDARRHALLLACKGNPDSSAPRRVYAFDLQTYQLDTAPVYTVNPLEVNELIPYGTDDKPHFFSPSGIAVHPLTGDIYILSSALKRLVVLDYGTGAIRYAARLDKKMLPQPEGIGFDPAGNLFIGSEGKKGEGLLLRFDFQDK